jgi:ribosomal protein L11
MRALKMVESEERKDSQQVEKIKQSYIKEISKIKKEDMFPVPKKISLWKKIKILLLGN